MKEKQKLMTLEEIFSLKNIEDALTHYKVTEDLGFRARLYKGIMAHIIEAKYVPSLHTEHKNTQTMGRDYHVLYKKPEPGFLNKLFMYDPKWRIIANSRPTSGVGTETEEDRVKFYLTYLIVEHYLVNVMEYEGIPRNFYPNSFGCWRVEA